MWPPNQLWAAYFMASRRLCSQTPLFGSDYPRVQISRKADYILATNDRGQPRDAVGPPLLENGGYHLYRQSPNVPGIDFCSQRRLDRIYSGPGHSPF